MADGLEYDDEGHHHGFSIWRPHTNHSTMRDILSSWLPSQDDGGYERFIEDYRLEGLISPRDLERLLIDDNVRPGKNLVGILSLLVPPEHASWITMKNMYHRTDSQLEVIDITPAQARQWLENFEPETAGEAIRLYRRSQLRTLDELSRPVGLDKTVIGRYEIGEIFPSVETMDKITRALKMGDRMRHLLMEAAEEHRWNMRSQLPDPVITEASPLGERIRSRRIKQRLTVAELSEMTGIPAGNITRFENGSRAINVHTLHKLADALSVDADTRKLWLGMCFVNQTSLTGWRKEFAALTGASTLFGSMIYHLGKSKGIQQYKIAEAAHMNRTELDSYKTGRAIPDADTVNRIADALGATDSERSALLLVAAENRQHADELETRRKKEEEKAAEKIAPQERLAIDLNQPFGDLLHQFRNRADLSPKELARAARIDALFIARYEKGLAAPAPDITARMANRMKLSPEEANAFLQSAENIRTQRQGSKKKHEPAQLAFGRMLNQLRLGAGMRLEQLQDASGISTTTLRRYELSQRHPNSEQAIRLADALGLQDSVRELFLRTAVETPSIPLHSRH